MSRRKVCLEDVPPEVLRKMLEYPTAQALRQTSKRMQAAVRAARVDAALTAKPAATIRIMSKMNIRQSTAWSCVAGSKSGITILRIGSILGTCPMRDICSINSAHSCRSKTGT